jgi:hypothetical protein
VSGSLPPVLCVVAWALGIPPVGGAANVPSARRKFAVPPG